MSLYERRVEVEMTTGQPTDDQRPTEILTSTEPSIPTEATQPLAAPPQPGAQATPQPGGLQPITPQPVSRQTLPPPLTSAPVTPRRRPLRWLVTAAALLVALLVALVVAAVGVTSWEASQPTATVAAFCGALKGQNYSAVYRQVPAGAKVGQSEAAFAQDAQLQDQLDGRVRACAVVKNSKDTNAWSQAPQSMTLQIARNHTYSGALTLTRDGLGWKIGALDTLSLGPIVGPWEAAQTFCAALTAGDYASAYGALSRQGQANATQDQFTKAFSDALASSKAQIASCQLDLASYAAQPTAATVVATLKIQTTTVNGAVSAPVKVRFSLVNESGAWKLDQIQPYSGS